MISIAICDCGEELSAEITDKLNNAADHQKIELRIRVFGGAAALKEHAARSSMFDLIIYGLRSDASGCPAGVREIREFDQNALFLFIGTKGHCAPELLEVKAFRYLTAPISNKKFNEYFNECVLEIYNNSKYFEYRYHGAVYRVTLSEILYFQSDRRRTYIVTAARTLVCSDKLSEIEERLTEGNIFFYRIHQSFLVNPFHVRYYSYDELELTDHSVFTISERRKKAVNELFRKDRSDLTI